MNQVSKNTMEHLQKKHIVKILYITYFYNICDAIWGKPLYSDFQTNNKSSCITLHLATGFGGPLPFLFPIKHSRFGLNG